MFARWGLAIAALAVSLSFFGCTSTAVPGAERSLPLLSSDQIPEARGSAIDPVDALVRKLEREHEPPTSPHAIDSLVVQESPPSRAEDDDGRLLTFAPELSFGAVSGYVQVRENAVTGTRLNLHDLGMNTASTLSFGFGAKTDDHSDVWFRVRGFDARGSGTFGQDIFFNGVTYEAGEPVHSSLELYDLLLQYRGNVLDFGDGGHLQLLAGAEFHYLTFQAHGTVAPTSAGNEGQEHFWKQELPLPSLGARVVYPLSSGVELRAQAFGFSVHHLNSLRSEGGTIYLWQDNFEADAIVGVRLSDACWLDLGYRYSYLYMKEESHEDMNKFLMRDSALVFGIRLRF
ncbi:MAG TPA: hypothetical protein VKE69_05480 [Planctomycetota bacterium]|nr:hypothetical protein [Planctomycetota bacterium]